MRITETIPPGDRPMDDIVEAVLSGSEAAMRARARAELDEMLPPARVCDLEIAPRSDIGPGMIVEVAESGQPLRYALVRSVSVTEARRDTTDGLQREMRITVEYREDQN